MLNDVLAMLGHKPTKQTAKRWEYKSPFNPQEKTSSFFTFAGSNGTNWKDYASGEGGDIYKFIMKYFSLTFPQAKAKIEELTSCDTSENIQHSTFSLKQQDPSYKINSVKELSENKPLMQYLESRGISSRTISKVPLKAIYYQISDRRYFAIGFMNDNEGYEIRNAYFKGNLKNKALTTILNQSKHIKVFEGFIDYLSYLEIAPNAKISDYLILNSVSLVKIALERLKGGYVLIELYLDNDKAGDKATQEIKSNLGEVKIIDKRPQYKGSKDLNKMLLNQIKGGNKP